MKAQETGVFSFMLEDDKRWSFFDVTTINHEAKITI